MAGAAATTRFAARADAAGRLGRRPAWLGPDWLGGGMNAAMLQVRLDTLRVEHRDLDAAIDALAVKAVPDQLQMARLKKRKLRLRDEMAQIEDRLLPDIIA
jgi:hypothetical protein